jgi:molecular chaperone GrpE
MPDDTRNMTAPASSEAGAASTDDHDEPTPPVPAGEPEAPVGPASPQPEPYPDEDGDDEPVPEEDDDDEPDHEAKLADDLEELTAKAQKADQYLELAQRTKADFENFRKRAAREASAALERGVVKLTRELLPAVDNLDRALEAATTGDGTDLVAGIKLVHAEVLSALARVGVEPFDPQGEAFDPTWHEAVAHQPVEGAQAGTVAEVYQRGYRLGETVIRPARVLVAG